MAIRTKREHVVRPTVSIAMKASPLRGLLHTDLERGGFDVRSDRTGPDIESADVVITDRRDVYGRLVTVVVGAEVEVYAPSGTWWFPSSELDRLTELLRAELQRPEAYGRPYEEGAA